MEKFDLVKVIGLLAGLMCIIHFALPAVSSVPKQDWQDWLYVSAYGFWVLYFACNLYKRWGDAHTKRMSFMGKLLACILLLTKSIFTMMGNTVDGTTTTMVASLLFLTSSLIYTQTESWQQSLGKIGSTILLACALAALKADGTGRETETNLLMGLAFVFLTSSVVASTKPQPTTKTSP